MATTLDTLYTPLVTDRSIRLVQVVRRRSRNLICLKTPVYSCKMKVVELGSGKSSAHMNYTAISYTWKDISLGMHPMPKKKSSEWSAPKVKIDGHELPLATRLLPMIELLYQVWASRLFIAALQTNGGA